MARAANRPGDAERFPGSVLEATPVLVLGLGNVLCSDDGAGIAALHRLTSEYRLPPEVRAVDGGTLGMWLLPLLEVAECVILVDAIGADEEVGALVRIEGDEVPAAVRDRLSPHQVGVADLISGAIWRDRYPGRVVLLGIVPATVELGLERTPAVERRLPDLVDAVVAEIAALGHPVRRARAGATSVVQTARALGW